MSICPDKLGGEDDRVPTVDSPTLATSPDFCSNTPIGTQPRDHRLRCVAHQGNEDTRDTCRVGTLDQRGHL